MKRRGAIGLADEQPHSVKVHPDDRVMITLRIVVNAADALVIVAD